MRGWTWSGISVLVVTGCGAAQGTQPEDMSVAQHQAAAEQHQQEAQHAGVHVSYAYVRGRGGTSDFLIEHDRSTVHRTLSGGHAAAAQALVDREAGACVGVGEADRGECPFEGGNGTVTDVEGGVEFHLDVDPANGAQVEAMARCHHATMAVIGLDDFLACPLAVRDIAISVAPGADGGVVLRVTTADPAAVDELRRRAHTMIGGGSMPAPTPATP